MKEMWGIHFHMDVISPEAFMAQRMEELRSIAEWKARRLKRIQDWAVTEKRDQIKEKMQFWEEEAKAQVLANPDLQVLGPEKVPFKLIEK